MIKKRNCNGPLVIMLIDMQFSTMLLTFSWPYIRYLAYIPAIPVNFPIPFYIFVILFLKRSGVASFWSSRRQRIREEAYCRKTDNNVSHEKRTLCWNSQRGTERERASAARFPSHISFSDSKKYGTKCVPPISSILDTSCSENSVFWEMVGNRWSKSLFISSLKVKVSTVEMVKRIPHS